MTKICFNRSLRERYIGPPGGTGWRKKGTKETKVPKFLESLVSAIGSHWISNDLIDCIVVVELFVKTHDGDSFRGEKFVGGHDGQVRNVDEQVADGDKRNRNHDGPR